MSFVPTDSTVGLRLAMYELFDSVVFVTVQVEYSYKFKMSVRDTTVVVEYEDL